MVGAYWEGIKHFAAIALTNIGVILTIVLVLWLNKKVGWGLPLEIEGLLNWIAHFVAPEQRRGNRPVNVEFRDARGVTIDLGPYFMATLKAYEGNSFALEDGYFRHCHLNMVAPGSEVEIRLAGNLKESLVVQLDSRKQSLFVESKFEQEELVRLINHQYNRRRPAADFEKGTTPGHYGSN
jgi:hypothetical protein